MASALWVLACVLAVVHALPHRKEHVEDVGDLTLAALEKVDDALDAALTAKLHRLHTRGFERERACTDVGAAATLPDGTPSSITITLPDGKGATTDEEFPVFTTDEEGTTSALAYMLKKGDYIKDPEDLVSAPELQGLQILYSFGAKAGGYEAVKDLADFFNGAEIGYKTYVDAMVLPNQKGRYVLMQEEESPGCFQDSSGHKYSPARSTNWRAWYKAAMKNAKAMIFLVTEEWLKSPNCKEEAGWAALYRSGGANLVVAVDTPIEDVKTMFSSLKGATIVGPVSMAASSSKALALQTAMGDLTANLAAGPCTDSCTQDCFGSLDGIFDKVLTKTAC